MKKERGTLRKAEEKKEGGVGPFSHHSSGLEKEELSNNTPMPISICTTEGKEEGKRRSTLIEVPPNKTKKKSRFKKIQPEEGKKERGEFTYRGFTRGGESTHSLMIREVRRRATEEKEGRKGSSKRHQSYRRKRREARVT